jgi:carbamoyl-phosphate synthase large subunit
VTRLLFTGGGGAGNEALFRLLGGRYECHFADADPAAIDDTIPADRRHKIPMARDPAFAPAVAGLCIELGFDMLVPGVDEELAKLTMISEAAPTLKVLAPSADYIARMDDKLSMIRALEAAGLTVPWTVTADNRDRAGFPAIAKPRLGRGSRAVRIVDSAAALDAYLMLEDLRAEDVILQELGRGAEYTVQMIADEEAVIHAVVPVRVGVKRGITLRARTEEEPTVDAACRAIHAAYPTGGCYNIQLILTADGRVLPFEINPRISTTFCLSVAAGIDPIAVFLGLAPKEDEAVAFRPGVGLNRHWRNSFTNTDPS